MKHSPIAVYETGEYNTIRCIECAFNLLGSDAVKRHSAWHLEQHHD